MFSRGEMFALALVAALGGCAESHESSCTGAPVAGIYDLAITPSAALGAECPVELRDVAVLDDGAFLPERCELVEAIGDQCGTGARFRCDTYDSAGALAEYELTIDVTWTADGAQGEADLVWLGAVDLDMCAGAYDVEIGRDLR